MLDDSPVEPAWWPDHTLIPFTGLASRALLDHALACLVLIRAVTSATPAPPSPRWSPSSEAEARLPDAVVHARVLGYTWNRIAERLGSTISAARQLRDYARCHQLRLFD